MAKNWALVIGINEYNPLNFTPLKYAKRDAERIKAFFETAGFERVFFFSDDSPRQTLPNGIEIPTQATYGNLISFLQGFFDKRFLDTGDNFWFFFAGHGERYHDEDYLMPMDANAIGSEMITGLKVNYVRERLCRCGADNIILILDACRSQGSRDGSGLGLEVQPGVITITSCQPKQKSWEVDELEQGVFTYALLEALQLPGEQSCATVDRLGSYLQRRVPELCQRYGKAPAQMPRIGADPIEKQHFILIPQYARQADLDLLKLDAYRLRETNPALAERICMRLNALAMGLDLEVIDLLTDLRHQTRDLTPASLELTPPSADSASARSAAIAATTTVGDVVYDSFSPPQTERRDSQAEAIEAEVLKPHQEYQRKRQDYEETLDQCLKHESPLSLHTINDLRDLRNHLRLKPEDVATIERAALNGHDLDGYVADLERQRQAQAQQQAEAQRLQQEEAEAQRRQQETEAEQKRQAEVAAQRQQEEAERQKQAKAEAERYQQEKEAAERKQREAAEVSRRLKAAATQQPSQPIGTRQPPQPIASPPSLAPTTTSSTTLSRQQFLKWGGLSGLGLIGAFSISQVLKDAPSTEVDYTQLETLLAAKQWKDADQETLNVMLKITNREVEGWLDVTSLQNFSCEALAKIDQLWVEASDGKFGFSVQKKIYVDNCGGQLDSHKTADFDCFADKIGWRMNDGSSIGYPQVIFDTTAPTGHLPVCGGMFWEDWWSGCGGGGICISFLLLQRLVNCSR